MKKFNEFKQEKLDTNNDEFVNEANLYKVFDDYFNGDYLAHGNDLVTLFTKLASRNKENYLEMIGMLLNNMDIALMQSKNNDDKISKIIQKCKNEIVK